MSKSKKVWVADDDESIRFVLEKGLVDAGFEVSVFEDGNEVVNQLDLDKPNVLLTDLKMPGRDGMDLLDTFKSEFSNIPVIMMTAHSDLDTTVDAFENSLLKVSKRSMPSLPGIFRSVKSTLGLSRSS
jgi:two-component system nitrogen regulation response regulator GlnG